MQTAREIRVTFLITTRNRAEFLERTLANVREFITPEDELIIIDGASTDHTKELVANHRDLVTVFVSEPDTGEAHAFNRGLFRARGRLLKPITDDDYFAPDAMRELIHTMEAHPEIDAIFTGGEIWRMEDGNPVFQQFRFLPTAAAATPESILDHANIGLGLIVRRAVFERTGGVSANYVSVDGDLACRLVECKSNLHYLDINLYRWYLHPHSGFNKKTAFAKDNLMIALRLGDWDHLFSRDPEELADIIGYRNRPGGLAQVYGVWAVNVLVKTPLRFLPYLTGRTLTVLRSWRRSLRGGAAKPSGPAVPAPPHWTGQLR